MQTYSLGCTLKVSFRKTAQLKDATSFYNAVRSQISLNSRVFHQPLWLKDLFFPQSHFICQKSDVLLVWMLWHCAYRQSEKDNILPPEQSPPNGSENTNKCSYGCAAIPHSSRKSFHQGCTVFLSHLSKDCCNSDANTRRRPYFTQEASDPLLLITTRLMQKNKWTKIKAGLLPREKTEFPLSYKVINIWRDALYFLAGATNSSKHGNQGFPRY